MKPNPDTQLKPASASDNLVTTRPRAQDLQHFLVERASLAASGLMSDEEWCAVTGEALRRLASLELKLELAMGTLVNWVSAFVGFSCWQCADQPSELLSVLPCFLAAGV